MTLQLSKPARKLKSWEIKVWKYVQENPSAQIDTIRKNLGLALSAVSAFIRECEAAYRCSASEPAMQAVTAMVRKSIQRRMKCQAKKPKSPL